MGALCARNVQEAIEFNCLRFDSQSVYILIWESNKNNVKKGIYVYLNWNLRTTFKYFDRMFVYKWDCSVLHIKIVARLFSNIQCAHSVYILTRTLL